MEKIIKKLYVFVMVKMVKFSSLTGGGFKMENKICDRGVVAYLKDYGELKIEHQGCA